MPADAATEGSPPERPKLRRQQHMLEVSGRVVGIGPARRIVVHHTVIRQQGEFQVLPRRKIRTLERLKRRVVVRLRSTEVTQYASELPGLESYPAPVPLKGTPLIVNVSLSEGRLPPGKAMTCTVAATGRRGHDARALPVTEAGRRASDRQHAPDAPARRRNDICRGRISVSIRRNAGHCNIHQLIECGRYNGRRGNRSRGISVPIDIF